MVCLEQAKFILKNSNFVFACVYLAPIAGVVYAYFLENDNDAAMRFARNSPMIYHVMSTLGVYFVFGDYLNPEVAPIHSAASMHIVYAILFALLYWTATGDENDGNDLTKRA